MLINEFWILYLQILTWKWRKIMVCLENKKRMLILRLIKVETLRLSKLAAHIHLYRIKLYEW
ncbi:MAG: hypothetical protein ACJARX_001974 [Psychroserpens sp.]|jgi:hypothetical protein